jgi:type I restriction enzyme R subunit
MTSSDTQIDPSRTFRDYLTEYKIAAKDKEVASIVTALGLDAAKLIALMSNHLTEANLNEYGRFDDLRSTIDREKAKAYFDGLEGNSLPIFKVRIKAARLLSDFLLRGAVDGSDST